MEKHIYDEKTGISYTLRGKLNSYLESLDKQAEYMFLRLVKQMAEREGVTEQLKAENQMEWVAQMNNIRNRVTETVNFTLNRQLRREINSLCPYKFIPLIKNQWDFFFLTKLKHFRINS